MKRRTMRCAHAEGFGGEDASARAAASASERPSAAARGLLNRFSESAETDTEAKAEAMAQELERLRASRRASPHHNTARISSSQHGASAGRAARRHGAPQGAHARCPEAARTRAHTGAAVSASRLR
eukprot:6172419-Pleurochrysis_carterae.AAC.3